MFSLVYAWINGWVNTRESGDLRRHHAHHDDTVMLYSPWWRHQMEIFSALLAICAGNSLVPGEFTQRPVTQSFDVFFDLRLNKRLSKQPPRLWFEMSLCSLWRQCNVVADNDPYGLLNTAAFFFTDVEFTCSRPDDGVIIWNIYPMSKRSQDPYAWPETNVAIGGNILNNIPYKYGLNVKGNEETLKIHSVTSEDAAVVECVGINGFKKRAQLVILGEYTDSWWRHQMETFSALLAICAGNSPVSGEFPTQRPVTRSFDVYFDLRLDKRLSKQSLGWWFETLSHSLWRHRNVIDR